MTVGGQQWSEYKFATVEITSLDEENHPVPECLRFPARYPIVISNAAGGTVDEGMDLIIL